MPGDSLRDALRYWEPRRVWYNVALSVEAAAWVVFTWPHFRPALSLQHLLQLMVLALLANLCYSAAYLVDLPLQDAFGTAWRQRLDGWAVVFLVTTILTSATGFGFPFVKFLPSHAVGIVSLVVLPVVIVAHYVKHFAGAWRRIYVVGVVLATYLNVFVLVAQLF